MSFLSGRLASTEGSYFLKESKQAVARIIQSQKNSVQVSENLAKLNDADVLPEVLRHRLPQKIFNCSSENSASTLSGASKWTLKPYLNPDGAPGASVNALNPLRDYVSLPQVTFGPKRWELPRSDNAVLASTANDLRQDKYVAMNPEKLKAAAVGLSHIGSAFAIATAIVFGGSAIVFSLLASKFELHSTDDIRSKGRGLVQPGVDTLREELSLMRIWAVDLSKKLHFEREGAALMEKPLFRQLSRNLGAKSSS